jgi:hypothetical protein
MTRDYHLREMKQNMLDIKSYDTKINNLEIRPDLINRPYDVCVQIEHNERRVLQIPAHFQNIIEEDRTCAICLSIVSTDMYLTPCFHLFHRECILHCVKRECPMCRKPL